MNLSQDEESGDYKWRFNVQNIYEAYKNELSKKEHSCLELE